MQQFIWKNKFKGPPWIFFYRFTVKVYTSTKCLDIIIQIQTGGEGEFLRSHKIQYEFLWTTCDPVLTNNLWDSAVVM